MSHKKSRKHEFGRGSGGGVNLGLIITPMLDMSFQLLAFFVMTYHPPVNVGFVEGALLPPTRDKEPPKAQPKEVKGGVVAKNKEEKKGKDEKDPKKVAKDKDPEVKKEVKDDKKLEDLEPELKADLLLVIVRSVKEGQAEGDRVDGDPNWIEIRRPEALSPARIEGDRKLARKDFVAYLRKELEKELKKILNEPGNQALKSANKAIEIKLEVDGRLKHGYWMKFYDTCKMSGFERVNFVAPSPEAQMQPR